MNEREKQETQEKFEAIGGGRRRPDEEGRMKKRRGKEDARKSGKKGRQRSVAERLKESAKWSWIESARGD